MNRPSTEPPELLPDAEGFGGAAKRSKEVLVFDTAWRVAVYEQWDDDCLPRWRSTCSEGWELRGVRVWTDLPPSPNEVAT